MSGYISDKVRNKVAKRAAHICEYCLIHEDLLYAAFHVDHIISLKHRGSDTINNLAFSRSRCNRNKGSDLASILEEEGEIIRFFNPRKDKWSDHFELKKAVIKGKSDIGKVTANIFGFNDIDRIEERRKLIGIGLYPYSDTPNI